MATIEKSIDVRCPIEIAYRQWTRFEHYPRIMDEVVSVTRTAAGVLNWRIRTPGGYFEWQVEITSKVPNRRIAWASPSSSSCSGMVSLHSLPGFRTRVMLQLAYPSEVLPGRVDAVTTMRRYVERSLQNFKRLVEGGAGGSGRGAMPPRQSSEKLAGGRG